MLRGRWLPLAAMLACAFPASASAATVVGHVVPKGVSHPLSQQARQQAQPLMPIIAGAPKPHAAHPQGAPGGVPGVAGSVAASKARTATRLDGPNGTPWTGSPSLPPEITTGKVFFHTADGRSWLCSGSLVNSGGKDLVITAGHCVYGASGGEIPGETWHTNWLFAPAYSNGNAPYGYWAAASLWTLSDYINSPNQTDESNDLGAAILYPNSSGQRAVDLLGGQGYTWNQNSSLYIWDFGYPAEAPFDGSVNETCDGFESYSFLIGMEVLPCNLTGGSSGGPWLQDFFGTDGAYGHVNGVNDARSAFFPLDITSLYFGDNAQQLYDMVQNL